MKCGGVLRGDVGTVVGEAVQVATSLSIRRAMMEGSSVHTCHSSLVPGVGEIQIMAGQHTLAER